MIRATILGIAFPFFGFCQTWEKLNLPKSPVTKIQIEKGKALYLEAIKGRPAFEDPALRLKAAAEMGYPLAQYEIFNYRVTRALLAGASSETFQSKEQAKLNLYQCYLDILKQAEAGDLDCMMTAGRAADTIARFKLTQVSFSEVTKLKIFWLRRASEAGQPEAPLELALTVFHNGESVSERLEGFELVKIQALKGNCISLHLLCNAYIWGEPKIALTKDLAKAQDWVDLLAKYCGGDETAIYPITPHPTR